MWLKGWVKGKRPGQTSTKWGRALSVTFLIALYFSRLLFIPYEKLMLRGKSLMLLEYH